MGWDHLSLPYRRSKSNNTTQHFLHSVFSSSNAEYIYLQRVPVKRPSTKSILALTTRVEFCQIQLNLCVVSFRHSHL